MIDHWFEVIELPMAFDHFKSLPRNPAYRYEYVSGCARLTPRPRCYQALLRLATLGEEPEDSSSRFLLRTIRPGDWTHFPALFSAAFRDVQPFSSLSDERRLEASCGCLRKTTTGGDGPIVEAACVVASCEDDDEQPVAALIVTLQSSRPLDADGKPANDLPHLTWIFVPPRLAREGLGTAMLHQSSRALQSLGYTRLASTFLLGNESSTLWHWRNGFTLREFGGSFRHLGPES